ncbi:MAG: hypothetical protein FJY92_08340 [Candidatus Hydrogenedentes bacterium]|nr:hypothetical protein [Candidatus Hydrogenedentota bacterium]
MRYDMQSLAPKLRGGMARVRQPVARRDAGKRVSARRAAGYTLLELIFVVFIIVLMLSIAMPKLMPAMLSSQLEGQARHIANYGRSAIAYSALHREPVTVRFDLARREYYCLRWSEDELGLQSGMESAGLSGIEGKDRAGLSRDPNKQADGLSTGSPNSQMTIQDLMATGTADDLEYQRDEVLYELDSMYQRSLLAQARNVPQESLLNDVDPLLKKKFSLETREEEELREEIQDTLLEHARLPEEIVIESIMLGGELVSEGVVDIEIAPLGLSETVSFILRGDKDEYFTVQWDPITGGSHLLRGKELGNAEAGL